MDKFKKYLAVGGLSAVTVYNLVEYPLAYTTGMDRPDAPKQHDFEQGRSGGRLEVGRPVALGTSTSTAGETYRSVPGGWRYEAS